jgi:hypothetical protein
MRAIDEQVPATNVSTTQLALDVKSVSTGIMVIQSIKRPANRANATVWAVTNAT